MILLWGLPGDPPFDAVWHQAAALATPLVVVDQRRLLDCSAELEVGPDGVAGTLRVGGRPVRLDAMTAAFVRPYDVRRLPEYRDPERHGIADGVENVLLGWSEVTPATVVNRPWAMSSNNSKPFQAALIRATGFATPETLVTTDPDAVLEFWRLHGQVIYKSLSGVRSVVRRLEPADRVRLRDVTSCPTMFQAHVRGTDVRVHVVGEQVFACSVTSWADDYRYPPSEAESPELETCDLPEEVSRRVRDLVRDLGLVLAGVDLRRTPRNEWYCFEVNPSPAFTYYESATGLPIGRAIASHLAGGLRSSGRREVEVP